MANLRVLRRFIACLNGSNLSAMAQQLHRVESVRLPTGEGNPVQDLSNIMDDTGTITPLGEVAPQPLPQCCVMAKVVEATKDDVQEL